MSSKSIRKELIARFPHREEEVKTHKDEINTAIMTAYHRVSVHLTTTMLFSVLIPARCQAAETGSAADVKPDVKPDVPATSQDEMPPSSMPLAQKPTKPKAAAPARRGGVAPQAEAETDEEYARRLHEELNSFSATRTTRNGATSSRSKASSSSSQKKRPKKGTSSAYVDSSDDDSVEPAKKKRRSTAKSGGGGGGGWQKPYALSPALADIVGASQMSRPQITKQLWVYIKAHDLQDPSDKRNIIPDERLRQVFNMNKMCVAAPPHSVAHHRLTRLPQLELPHGEGDWPVSTGPCCPNCVDD